MTQLKVVSWRQWENNRVNIGTSGILQENQAKKQTFRCQVSPLVTAESGRKQLLRPSAQAATYRSADQSGAAARPAPGSGCSVINSGSRDRRRQDGEGCGRTNEGMNVSAGASQ